MQLTFDQQGLQEFVLLVLCSLKLYLDQVLGFLVFYDVKEIETNRAEENQNEFCRLSGVISCPVFSTSETRANAFALNSLMAMVFLVFKVADFL